MSGIAEPDLNLAINALVYPKAFKAPYFLPLCLSYLILKTQKSFLNSKEAPSVNLNTIAKHSSFDRRIRNDK